MLRLNAPGRGALCWMPAATFRIEARRSGCWGGTRGVPQTLGCAPWVPWWPHLLIRLCDFPFLCARFLCCQAGSESWCATWPGSRTFGLSTIALPQGSWWRCRDGLGWEGHGSANSLGWGRVGRMLVGLRAWVVVNVKVVSEPIALTSSHWAWCCWSTICQFDTNAIFCSSYPRRFNRYPSPSLAIPCYPSLSFAIPSLS